MPDTFVERVGFGCARLADETTSGRALRLLETAHDAGIRYFDTAPGYGAGYSERILGDFLKTRRDRVTIATKIGLKSAPSGRQPAWLALPLSRIRRGFFEQASGADANDPASLALELESRSISRAEVEASVTQSLRSLRTERIDVLLLQDALPSFLHPDAHAYLQALLERGIVGALGVAAHGAHLLCLTAADLEGWDVLQYEYGPAWPRHVFLKNAFPKKRHVLHGCLSNGDAELSVGARLAAAAQAVPGALVLFSSSNPDLIQANVRNGESAWATSGE